MHAAVLPRFLLGSAESAGPLPGTNPADCKTCSGYRPTYAARPRNTFPKATGSAVTRTKVLEGVFRLPDWAAVKLLLQWSTPCEQRDEHIRPLGSAGRLHMQATKVCMPLHNLFTASPVVHHATSFQQERHTRRIFQGSHPRSAVADATLKMRVG